MGTSTLYCTGFPFCIHTANPLPQYQIETQEIEDFRDELRIWRTCGSLENRPPPMIIDVFLDTSRLNESQTLVLVDDDGRRWDALERLSAAASSPPTNSFAVERSGNTEIVLERWRVELTCTNASLTDDFGPVLPTVYKKAIVFFRSLFIATRLLPTWKLSSQNASKSAHPVLRPRCRIRMSEPDRLHRISLTQSIGSRRDAVTEYMFGDLEVPVGRLSTCVTYRNDVRFRVDDSESLLSSRFMRVDENFFRPSLPQRRPTAEVGSLRDHDRTIDLGDMRQTYGSLSTFHGEGPLGLSPISALRAIRPPGSDASSPTSSMPAHGGVAAPGYVPPSGRPSVLSRAPSGGEVPARRTSMSFQPFKAGSLSGSPIPRTLESDSQASTPSTGLPAAYLPAGSLPRNRSSLTAGMPASLRGGPPAAAPEVAALGSPRPSSTSRYSSSFTHRRARPSLGGASKAGDEEQNSSGRQSLASSMAQPGSGLLTEAGGASSGSLQAEDEISIFLKALDSRKTLRSFEAPQRGESASSRTLAQLSKLHLMKESNNALGESMTSSIVQMHRSSSSFSRQLASVPGMVAPASVSTTSSSPGKPLSPHTPHTPAVPSRLSENSIIDYGTAAARVGPISSGGRRQRQPGLQEARRDRIFSPQGTTAIDIPLSPRIGTYQRRSSSVAHQSRTLADEEEVDLVFAAHRSTSLGAGDREAPTMSALLGRQMHLAEDDGTAREDAGGGGVGGAGPAAETGRQAGRPGASQRGSAEENPPEGLITSTGSSSLPGRRQCLGMAGTMGRRTPPPSSRASFTGSMGRCGRADDESLGEEPLVFDLSEMEAQGRRSMEDSRGGGNTGLDRGAFEPRGTTRRGWS